MAAFTLTIPDFDEEMMARLRIRAARHGHSIESEIRIILINAVDQSPTDEHSDPSTIHDPKPHRDSEIGAAAKNPNASVVSDEQFEAIMIEAAKRNSIVDRARYITSMLGPMELDVPPHEGDIRYWDFSAREYRTIDWSNSSGEES